MREFVQDVDERITAQIAAAAANGGDWGPGEQQTCMTAAALVVAKGRTGHSAAVPHGVLAAICALPLEHFNGSAMRDIVFAWHWIVASGAWPRFLHFLPGTQLGLQQLFPGAGVAATYSLEIIGKIFP